MLAMDFNEESTAINAFASSGAGESTAPSGAIDSDLYKY
jgi:hypothetical protein